MSETPDDAVRIAKECLTDLGSSLAETVANLRHAIEAGTVPPTVAARMAAFLEDLAVRAADAASTSEEGGSA